MIVVLTWYLTTNVHNVATLSKRQSWSSCYRVGPVVTPDTEPASMSMALSGSAHAFPAVRHPHVPSHPHILLQARTALRYRGWLCSGISHPHMILRCECFSSFPIQTVTTLAVRSCTVSTTPSKPAVQRHSYSLLLDTGASSLINTAAVASRGS